MSREQGRRSRWVWIAVIAVVALAVIGAGTAWLVTSDDEDESADQPEEIGWESLQTGARNPVFPGSPPLELELDANAVPLLHEVINVLDPEGAHVGPPETGGSATQLDRGVPVAVGVTFDWDGLGDVDFTLTSSMGVARTVSQPCLEACTKKQVGGREVVVTGEPGIREWLVVQPDGEVVVLDPASLPDGLDVETLLDATDDLDLPEEDLTPEPPTDPVRATMEQLGQDHLDGLDAARLVHHAEFSGQGPHWRNGRLVDADYSSGQLSGSVDGLGDDGAEVSWGYAERSSISSEDDSSCDPEEFESCGDRVVDGHRVHLMWEYAAAGAKVVLRYDGPQRRAWVRVPYVGRAGRAGSGTPVVPLEDLVALVTDPRWQQ